MIQVCKMRIPKSLDRSILMALLSCVDINKRKKIMRYVRQEDQFRSLFAELLARLMIFKRTGICLMDIVFSSNQYGKPELCPIYSLHVNWTHSGEWVACALDQQKVGIDIEQIQEVTGNLVSSCLSADEIFELDKKDKKEREAYFYELWTLKECFVKWDGRGMAIPFRSISFKQTKAGSYHLSNDVAENPSCYLNVYPVDDNYKLAICSSSGKFPLYLSVLDYRQMIDAILNH